MDGAFTLALRLRSVSTHLNGWKPDGCEAPLESRVAHVNQAVERAIAPHASLQRLFCNYERFQQFLKEPATQKLDPEVELALVLDNAPAMHDFVRAMQSCKELDERGVAGAGDLAAHELLQERLKACVDLQHAQSAQLESVQARITALLERYGHYVDQLSQVFVSLDATLQQLEKAHAQTQQRYS